MFFVSLDSSTLPSKSIRVVFVLESLELLVVAVIHSVLGSIDDSVVLVLGGGASEDDRFFKRFRTEGGRDSFNSV